MPPMSSVVGGGEVVHVGDASVTAVARCAAVLAQHHVAKWGRAVEQRWCSGVQSAVYEAYKFLFKFLRRLRPQVIRDSQDGQVMM